MKPLFIAALVAGLAMLVGGYLEFADSESQGTGKAVAVFDRPSAPTAAPGATETVAPTSSPSPPFEGSVSRFELARLGISNAVEEIGLVPDTNDLDTPHDAVNKVGWYGIYDRPGSGGNAVFSAHKNYNFKQGPFAKLEDVLPDDEIVIEMDGGPTYRYKVFRKQRYSVEAIPMGELISPKDKPAGEERITLITCGGRFVATQANGLGVYKERDVVVAVRVQ